MRYYRNEPDGMTRPLRVGVIGATRIAAGPRIPRSRRCAASSNVQLAAVATIGRASADAAAAFNEASILNAQWTQ